MESGKGCTQGTVGKECNESIWYDSLYNFTNLKKLHKELLGGNVMFQIGSRQYYENIPLLTVLAFCSDFSACLIAEYTFIPVSE